MVRAQVREWHADLGWGVLDSPETRAGLAVLLPESDHDGVLQRVLSALPQS